MVGAAQDAAMSVRGFGLAAGALTGATPGAAQYLSTAGNVSESQPSTSGHHVIRLGWAINATDLWFQPVYLGVRA